MIKNVRLMAASGDLASKPSAADRRPPRVRAPQLPFDGGPGCRSAPGARCHQAFRARRSPQARANAIQAALVVDDDGSQLGTCVSKAAAAPVGVVAGGEVGAGVVELDG